MSGLPGFGLPLRTSATIWKKGRHIDLPELLAVVTDELRRQGAAVETTEDGVRAKLPVVRWKPRELAEWKKVVPFEELRTIDVQVAQSDRAFHLIVSGRTSVLVPLLSALVAYALTASLVHPGPFVAPLIGFGVGLVTWANVWLRFNVGVHQAADRCAATMTTGGA